MARGRAVKPGQRSSPRKRSAKPVSSVTKKVRMTEEEAARLAELAARTGRTESDILREGIALHERQSRRDEAIRGLMKMAERDGPEPPKLRFRSK